MKAKFTFLFLIICHLLESQSINQLWSKGFSGAYLSSFFITTDPAGNVFSSGWMHDSVDFDPGPGVFKLKSTGPSAYICKQDPNGNLVWAVNLPTASNARYDLKTDALGNVYSVGFFSGNCDFDPGQGTYVLSGGSTGFTQYIWKLNANGTFVWAQKIPSQVFVSSCLPDANGNLFISGSFSGTADLDFGTPINSHTSQGTADAFICKLDPSGNLLFVKQFESGSSAVINSLLFGPNSTIYATGTFSNSVNANPGSSANILNSGGPYFNTVMDASGNFVSAIAIAYPSGSVTVRSVINDANGNFYTYGVYNGICDFDPSPSSYTLQASTWNIFLSKLNSSGNLVWVKSFDAQVSSSSYVNLLIDNGNNLYLSSSSFSMADCDPGPSTYTVGPGPFLTVLNASGSFIEAANIPNAINCVDQTKNIYCVGGYLTGPYAGAITKYGSILTGITTQSKETIHLNVFPNPANGLFTFSSNSLKDSYTAEIYNSLGQKLLTQKIDSEQTTIDLTNCQSGIYLLQLLNKGAAVGYSRLVKE